MIWPQKKGVKPRRFQLGDGVEMGGGEGSGLSSSTCDSILYLEYMTSQRNQNWNQAYYLLPQQKHDILFAYYVKYIQHLTQIHI